MCSLASTALPEEYHSVEDRISNSPLAKRKKSPFDGASDLVFAFGLGDIISTEKIRTLSILDSHKRAAPGIWKTVIGKPLQSPKEERF